MVEEESRDSRVEKKQAGWWRRSHVTGELRGGSEVTSEVNLMIGRELSRGSVDTVSIIRNYTRQEFPVM
jgi:hypothetical protein